MFVIRARYVQPDGIGYLTTNGWISRERSYAKEYASEADAWAHGMADRDHLGRPVQDWWVEPA